LLNSKCHELERDESQEFLEEMKPCGVAGYWRALEWKTHIRKPQNDEILVS